MAGYGSDFTTGRFNRRPASGFGGGYDSSFGGTGRGLTGAQGAGWYGWTDHEQNQRGWDDFGSPDRFADRGEGSFGRDFGRQPFGRDEWQGFDRSGSSGFDRFGAARRSPGRGSTGYDPMGYGSGGYGSGGYGGYRRTLGPSGYASQGQGYQGYASDRGMDRMSRGHPSESRFGGRGPHDYDEDFSDRVRRGWNRFRDEARSWMGRGYDRGW